MRAKRLFDAYLVVDWSAASRPKLGADSIWIALQEGGRPRLLENVATRERAEQLCLEAFVEAARRGRRLLAGFDFSFGFPAGAAAALGARSWEAVWARLTAEVSDDEHNRNNRFSLAAAWNREMTGRAAPLWGCPPAQASALLTPTRPGRLGFPARRLCERRAGARSTWQLFYNGSVGSQSLLGVPRLERLRKRAELGGEVRVWPFETGFRVPGDEAVSIAEVYPSLWPAAAAEGEVKDRAQVRGLAARFAALDRAGELAALFAPPLEANTAQIEAALREEGWILGVR